MRYIGCTAKWSLGWSHNSEIQGKEMTMPDSMNNQAPQVTPPQPYMPRPFGTPPRKSGLSVLKIVLIVVAIFVGLGLIGIGVLSYGIYRVAKSVETSSTSSQPMTEADLGIAIYPGATQGKGSMRMKIAGENIVTAAYLTPDSKDQVLAFYNDKMGPDARPTTSANGGGFVLSKSPRESLTVKVTQAPGMNDGNTQIIIVHASKTSSN